MADDHVKTKASGDNAIKPNPLLYQAYNNRGVAKYNLGDYQGAVTDFDKAIELNPQYAQAYYNRGAAKRALGDTEGAEHDVAKATELDRLSDATGQPEREPS